MQEQLKNRLRELKAEFEAGQSKLAEVEGQANNLRTTMLRISGAIQVLEEELAKASGAAPGAEAGQSVSTFGGPLKPRGANAHLVIDRDGTVFQCRPFNRTCGHAGVSRWRDPRTKKLYTGCNDFSIGIENANAGDEERVAQKNSKLPLVQAKHRNGGPEQKWEAYPPEQLASVFRVVSLLMDRYKSVDITGHECIAPERKNDPGPAFPMEELRKANGLGGLPEVCRK